MTARNLWMISLMSAVLFQACAADNNEETRFSFIVRVTDGEGEAVQGAIVDWKDGRSVMSDESGEARLETSGREGEPRRVRCACPTGSVLQSAGEQDVVLKLMASGSGALDETVDASDIGQLVEFVCSPAVRSHILIVRTHGRSNVPVLVSGKPVARTDESGIAHVVVSGIAEDVVDVTLDTEGFSSLRPAMPSRRFILPDRARFLVFDQPFEERKPPRARRGPALLKNRGPVRL